MEKKFISGSAPKNCMSKVASELKRVGSFPSWAFQHHWAVFCDHFQLVLLSLPVVLPTCVARAHHGNGRASLGGCAWCLAGNHIKASQPCFCCCDGEKAAAQGAAFCVSIPSSLRCHCWVGHSLGHSQPSLSVVKGNGFFSHCGAALQWRRLSQPV